MYKATKGRGVGRYTVKSNDALFSGILNYLWLTLCKDTTGSDALQPNKRSKPWWATHPQESKKAKRRNCGGCSRADSSPYVCVCVCAKVIIKYYVTNVWTGNEPFFRRCCFWLKSVDEMRCFLSVSASIYSAPFPAAGIFRVLKIIRAEWKIIRFPYIRTRQARPVTVESCGMCAVVGFCCGLLHPRRQRILLSEQSQHARR